MTCTTYSEEKNDLEPKIIFKAVSDLVKVLDQKRRDVRYVSDLFTNSLEAQRVRLRTFIEKLMFSASKEYGRRCEEILWKKCYHDVYSTIKSLRKGADLSSEEVLYAQYLLNNGVGYYHHLLTRLSDSYNLSLSSVVDFPMFIDDYGLSKLSLGTGTSKSDKAASKRSEETLDWAREATYKCLTYIGDLNRYMLDIYPGWDPGTAAQFYWQALMWDPNVGNAFNQLGSLSLAQNNVIDAAYYYMRSAGAAKPFVESERNLMNLFEKYGTSSSSIESNIVKGVIVWFLQLADSLYFQNRSVRDTIQICAEFTEVVNTFYSRRIDYSTFIKPILQPNSLPDLLLKKDVPDLEQVYPDTQLKMLLITFICHERLSKKGSPLTENCIGVISMLMRHLLDSVLIKLKLILPDPVPPAMKRNAARLRRFRRRRRGGVKLNVNSELSESDEGNCSSSSTTKDDSEEELIFDQVQVSSADENDSRIKPVSENAEGTLHGIEEITKNAANKSSAKLLVQLLQEHHVIFQTVKVCCDWIESNEGVLRQADYWITFVENFVLLLNYIHPVYNVTATPGNITKLVSLPEDVHTRGMTSLKEIHSVIEYNFSQMRSQNVIDQIKVRAQRLENFGEFLSRLGTFRVSFDSGRKWFTILTEAENDEAKKVQQDSSSLKQDGVLHLQEEASRPGFGNAKSGELNKNLPLYLVLDLEAIIQFQPLFKKLVFSKKFFIIVPSAVIAIVDQLKLSNPGIRDISRWMESQFRLGNKHIRIQRYNETASLPLMDNLKKKDRNIGLLVQVLECCNFLMQGCAANAKAGIPKDPALAVRYLTGIRTISNVVTGNATDNDLYQIAVAAKTAGIPVEHVTDFHSRWRTCLKNRR